MPLTPIKEVEPSRRLELAETIEDRMNGPISALGVVFLLLVLAETVSQPQGWVATAFTTASWVLWLVFAFEFALRWYVAPDRKAFIKKNWWQLIFLALPFFRFVRVLARFRALRAGRVVSSATRSSRSTRSLLGGRVGWLAVLTLIVALSSSQLLYEFSSYPTYTGALYASTLATISGEPLAATDALSRILNIALSLYSVVVFASLAGIVGAYFLRSDEVASRKSASVT